VDESRRREHDKLEEIISKCALDLKYLILLFEKQLISRKYFKHTEESVSSITGVRMNKLQYSL
jgi:hypothetical protein